MKWELILAPAFLVLSAMGQVIYPSTGKLTVGYAIYAVDLGYWRSYSINETKLFAYKIWW